MAISKLPANCRQKRQIFHYVICIIPNCYRAITHQSKSWHSLFLYIYLPKNYSMKHIQLFIPRNVYKVSKIMQKIAKIVQNYSKYNSQIFAGNFRHCRQSVFAGKLPASPMSTCGFETRGAFLSGLVTLV